MMIQSAVIASHTFSPGTSQGLYEYMKRHGYDVTFIGHDLFGNPVNWAWGAVDTFWKSLIKPGTIDIYVGSNRLNAYVGILLKWVGKVRKVIYFSPDWVEDRLSNKLLNNLYQWLDFFCVQHADVVWNSSAYMDVDPMMKERRKRGYPEELMKKQTQLPDGTDPYDIKSGEDIDRYKIGFVGHIKEGMGLEMLIESIKDVIFSHPKAHLVIIGSGPILDTLKEKAQGLPITFTGFMGDLADVYKTLEDCAFAVAPYEKGTISQYTDPGKVKVYFSVGLPIIISTIPQISKEIASKQAGIVIEDTQEELTRAMKTLLSDDTLLKNMRQNVRALNDKYSWDTIFDNALNNI